MSFPTRSFQMGRMKGPQKNFLSSQVPFRELMYLNLEQYQVPLPVGMPAPRENFKVYYQSAVGFYTNIDEVMAKPMTEGQTGVTTYYVDRAAGNDATGDGSSGNPYKTINKAMTVANTFGNVKLWVIIKAKGDRFVRGEGWFQSTINQTKLQLESWDGLPVYMTVDYPSLVWALDSGTTYVATSDSANPLRSAFWDKRVLGPDGDYVRLDLVADLATCRATPGTYFVTGTSMYVNRTSGLAPDADLICMDNNTGNGTYKTVDGLVYLDNIKFEGGAYGFQCHMFPNSSSAVTFKAKQCAFKYGASEAIARDSVLSFQANATVFLWQCDIVWSIQDGIGYSNAATGMPAPYAVEVDCNVRWNGYTATGANQGSTGHVGTSIIRVNGDYHDNQDAQIQDVTGSKSWNLGVDAGPTQTADANFSVGFALAADAISTMWLDGCTSNGSPADILAGVGATLYYSGMTPAVPVTTGGGTISTYDPGHEY